MIHRTMNLKFDNCVRRKGSQAVDRTSVTVGDSVEMFGAKSI
jgi:hypothetical protein